NTEHYKMTIQPDEPERIRDMVHHLDEPFADASFIPASYVSELASRHVKTVNTGDGADESLGGYEWYRAFRYALTYNQFPGWTRSLLNVLGRCLPHVEAREGWIQNIRRFKTFTERLSEPSDHPLDLFHNLMGSESEHYKTFKKILKDPGMLNQNYRDQRRTIYDEYDGDNPLEGIMYTQMRTLLPDLFFTKIDRMSMMHSLEARSPFADHELQEFLARLPLQYKNQGQTGKYILKKVAERYLPNNVIYRQKMGFSIPIGRWMREGPYREFTRDILGSRAFKNRGLFDVGAVQELMEEHESGKKDHWTTLWPVLCLELWYQECHD
ncbi:MAG: asparagine synthetase B, partial [bacterium]